MLRNKQPLTNHERWLEKLNAPLVPNIGKQAKFTGTIINVGGQIIWNKGDIVFLRNVDCGMYKISKSRTGKILYGLWKTDAFEIIARV